MPRLSAALLLAIAGPALAGKKDDTIRFAYDQAPESVDPFFNNVRIGVIIGANVWDTLVTLDPKTNEYKGNLAKSWKQIDDKTIEFDLREGVKFHNGEEFDADSVVYTLNFVADPANKVTTQANVNAAAIKIPPLPFIVLIVYSSSYRSTAKITSGCFRPAPAHPQQARSRTPAYRHRSPQRF